MDALHKKELPVRPLPAVLRKYGAQQARNAKHRVA